MLSRGGGAVAFQRIVTRVADLPSPLDAQPGERIIVRETEEVYGLNANTRMWEVIGTLKKVGGRRPEELGSHLDSSTNPHTTTFQQTLDAGPSAKVEGVELTGGAKPVLRINGTGTALKIGRDAGAADGMIWANAEARAANSAFLRFVRNATDQFVVNVDGSVVSSGAASFAGGFSGPAVFDDEITASEGVFAAKGYDLLLGSDKSLLFRIGDQTAAAIDARGALIHGSIEASGDLKVRGLILSNLNPQGDLSLGDKNARWKSAAFQSLDLAPKSGCDGVVIRVSPDSKAHALLVTSSATGDTVAVTSGGAIGLGTEAPERRLDVRGNGIVVGNDDARISIDSCIAFNRGADGKPRNPALASWTIVPGGANDAFSVTRRGTSGDVLTLVHADAGGISLHGDVGVIGSLDVAGSLNIGAVSGHSGQCINFDKRTIVYTAADHIFAGPVKISGSFDVSGVLSIKDGNLVGAGNLGSAASPWKQAFADVLIVGDTAISSGGVKSNGAYRIESPVLSIGPTMEMSGAEASVRVLDVLEVVGAGGSMIVGVGQHPGLSFDCESPATIHGVGELVIGSAPGVTDPAISVSQTWTDARTYAAMSVRIDDRGSDASSVLADYRVNDRRVAAIRKDRMEIAGNLHVGGLAFKRLQEDLKLDGIRTETKFKIPAGVRVEAVVVTMVEAVSGARFVQVGDSTEPDRFAGPTTDLAGGSMIKGLNHCDRGLSVQKVAGPVVITADAPATGRVRITVYYVDPASI